MKNFPVIMLIIIYSNLMITALFAMQIAVCNVDNPILMAAREGDMISIRRYILLGEDIFVHDNSGRTALHFAVERNHAEMVQLLIDVIIKDFRAEPGQMLDFIEARDSSGKTALSLIMSKWPINRKIVKTIFNAYLMFGIIPKCLISALVCSCNSK